MGGPDQHRKETPRPGISATEADKLRSLITALEKDVKSLKERREERNQWDSTVQGWLGKRVTALVTTGQRVVGVLRWLDRYTICVEGSYEPDRMVGGAKIPAASYEIILHKGQLVLIHLAPEMMT